MSRSPSPRRPELDELAAQRMLQLLRAPAASVAGPVLASGASAVGAAAGHPAGWVPAPPPGARRGPARPEAAPAELGGATGRHTAPGGAPHREAGARHTGLGETRPGRHRAVRPSGGAIPAGLRSARWHPRSGAIVAVLAVAVVAGVWFAVRVAAAARAAEPTSVPARTAVTSRSIPAGFATGADWGAAASAAGSATGSAPGAGGAASSAAPGAGRIVVHVVGEIARPGIVLLPQGARVIDAVTAAGGALPSADLERINLARAVADGEQVHVPAPGEQILPGAFGSTIGPVGGQGVTGGSAAAAPGRVNLNTAGLAELDTLPGVGPVLAQRILDWRREHGRFTSVDELGEVSGIGERLLAQLTDRVTL